MPLRDAMPPIPSAPPRARAWLSGCVAALCLIVVGCAARRAAPQAEAPAAAHEVADARREIEQALAERRTGVTALRGRGTLWVSSPTWDGAARVQAIVLARRPEDLRVRGYTPLSTAFDCLAAPDRFVLHLPEPGEAWTGPAEELGPATGLPLVPADLVDALFGAPFEIGDSLVVRRVESDVLEASWRLPDGSEVEARFARHPTRPQGFRLLRDGRVRVELEYGDYLLEEEGWWPRRYDLSWPEDESYFRLQLVAVELNPAFEPKSFELEPPAGTQWIRVRSADAGPPAGGKP